jgi:hypothetical protein
MQCAFCGHEIPNYALATLDIIASPDDGAGVFGAAKYSLAMVECPNCDMVFFLKPSSKRLKDMRLLLIDEITSSMLDGVNDISEMTHEEKDEIYERMKKMLIEKYT